MDGDSHSYWIHLENKQEAVLFNTKYDPLQHAIMGNFNEFQDEFQDESPLKLFT